MEENKSWYLSKTVWGGLITVAASFAGMFGLSIGLETQGELADYMVMGATVIGGLVAIYGRIKASKTIK